MSQSILHGWEEVAVSARPALEVVERRLHRCLVPAGPPCGEALPLFLLQGRVDFEHRDWCTTAGAVSVHTHHYAGAVGLTPGLDVCRILDLGLHPALFNCRNRTSHPLDPGKQ